MSVKNHVTFENTTIIIDAKNDPVTFNLFHTLFLSLCVVSSVLLFATMVYYMIKKKRQAQLRHCLVPLYHFDPGECEDWEEELLEEACDIKTERNTVKVNL